MRLTQLIQRLQAIHDREQKDMDVYLAPTVPFGMVTKIDGRMQWPKDPREHCELVVVISN